ncbi:unnamed protein product [Vitrella brassicaformis CCMP3155]|uniref:PPIase cyclophilin-type domain-containing protein n=1 Tax=Vitrella brassicaformis (strain CCMP3155) TaxID=1169540 RepID=A0A0G4FHH3_VITBC|nr:unnamed protein product [Vitrella brassicaformis CCMP3155]|eukprot:CEM12875.1 unnamed protein product [Vitrella brassicaformis CCMP3155]
MVSSAWFTQQRGILGWWLRTSTMTKATISIPVVVGPTYLFVNRQKSVKRQQFYYESVTEKVYLDLAIGNRYIGRILIGLYGNQVPLTCENFVQLIKGYKVGDKIIGYRNTLFYRSTRNVFMMGGDVIRGTGTHGLSIYGPKFPDENFQMEFIQDGDVAMVSTGPNSNNSQFFITFSPMSRIEQGRCVVFGTVLKGMRVVREVEQHSTRVGRPCAPIRIIDCGLWEPGKGPDSFTLPRVANMAFPEGFEDEESEPGVKELLERKEFLEKQQGTYTAPADPGERLERMERLIEDMQDLPVPVPEKPHRPQSAPPKADGARKPPPKYTVSETDFRNMTPQQQMQHIQKSRGQGLHDLPFPQPFNASRDEIEETHQLGYTRRESQLPFWWHSVNTEIDKFLRIREEMDNKIRALRVEKFKQLQEDQGR